MDKTRFDEGMKILEAAFQRKYSPESYKLFWGELKDRNGDALLTACRILAREETRLPSLSMIFARLPQETSPEEPENFEHELWTDKMRRLYNASAALPTREERFAFADALNLPDRNALADAVVLYEIIWPQICRQNPMADKETKARLALDRLINHDPRIRPTPAPAWYKKKYASQKPATPEAERLKFEMPSPPPAEAHTKSAVVAPGQAVAPPEVEFTEENLPF